MTYFSKLDVTKPKLIGFVGFNGVTTLDLSGPLEAFAAARTEDGERCYEALLIGASTTSFVAASGAMFKAHYTLASAPALDTIVIPGGAALHLSETSKMIADWLRANAASLQRIASVSTGIYPLAQSGLLDGRRVTTHWKVAQNVASTFPRVTVSDTGAFVKHDKFYTCGGGTAGIEMSLALIQEDYGARVALRLARELLVSLRPASGDERHLVPLPQFATPEERLAELPAWIASRLQDDLSVEVLAARACLCPRHFSRIFKRRFNMTPASFVERLRISEAARRLVGRRMSVEEVANSVGYKTPEVFRRAFERRYGMAPRMFRISGQPAPPKRKRHIRRRFAKLPGRGHAPPLRRAA